MKYMGSKNRLAKELLPIILKDRKEGQWYVEPFVGGCNIIDKVDGNRIGSDANKYLIAMWRGLQESLNRPYIIDKNLYSRAREEYRNNTNNVFSDFEIGWIGFMGSYNGRFFEGGYSGHSVMCKNGKKRDYISENIRNTSLQIENIREVIFKHYSYEKLDIPDNSILYCDIPYENTSQYHISRNFDYEKFWNWCREQSVKGHKVFISEYNAPDDFECIWEKEVTNSINATRTYKPTEKLFIYKSKIK